MALKGVEKLVGMVIGLVVLVLFAGWVGTRWWAFKREAPLRAGISALKEGDYQLALRRLKPFAEAGNAHAQSALAEMYGCGLGVPYDEVQASMWYRRSECGRKVTGMGEYGMFKWYLEVEPDRAKAVRWLQRSAEAGNPQAQNLLADEKQLAEKGLTVAPEVSRYWQKYASPPSLRK
jgi:TPR repeat protein